MLRNSVCPTVHLHGSILLLYKTSKHTNETKHNTITTH